MADTAEETTETTEEETKTVEEQLRGAETKAERTAILEKEADVAIAKAMYAQNFENGSTRLQRPSLRNLQSMRDYLGSSTDSTSAVADKKSALSYRRVVLKDW